MKKNSTFIQELADAALKSALEWAKFKPKDAFEIGEDALSGTSKNLRRKMEEDFNKYTFMKYEFNSDDAELIERYRFINARIEEAMILFVRAYTSLTEEEYSKLHKGLIEITNSDKKWVADDPGFKD